MENINDQHTVAHTFSSIEETVTSTTQIASNITSDVSSSIHITTNTVSNTPLIDQKCLEKVNQINEAYFTPEPESQIPLQPTNVLYNTTTATNTPLRVCETPMQDDTPHYTPHLQPPSLFPKNSTTLWREFCKNADSKASNTPKSRCFSGFISPHKSSQALDNHILKRSMDKSELRFSSVIDQHESTSTEKTININIESMVGVLFLHNDFYSIIPSQISAVRRHFTTAFESYNKNQRELHSLRILYDEKVKGFFSLLLPAFGKAPTAAMVNLLYMIASNLSNISTTQDIKLIEYLKKKIKIKSTNRFEMPLSSEKVTINPTTKPQPSFHTTSIILKSDNPKIYSFLTRSDFENIILKGLSLSYSELESLTISFTPRPAHSSP